MITKMQGSSTKDQNDNLRAKILGVNLLFLHFEFLIPRPELGTKVLNLSNEGAIYG